MITLSQIVPNNSLITTNETNLNNAGMVQMRVMAGLTYALFGLIGFTFVSHVHWSMRPDWRGKEEWQQLLLLQLAAPALGPVPIYQRGLHRTCAGFATASFLIRPHIHAGRRTANVGHRLEGLLSASRQLDTSGEHKKQLNTVEKGECSKSLVLLGGLVCRPAASAGCCWCRRRTMSFFGALWHCISVARSTGVDVKRDRRQEPLRPMVQPGALSLGFARLRRTRAAQPGHRDSLLETEEELCPRAWHKRKHAGTVGALKARAQPIHPVRQHEPDVPAWRGELPAGPSPAQPATRAALALDVAHDRHGSLQGHQPGLPVGQQQAAPGNATVGDWKAYTHSHSSSDQRLTERID